MTLTDFVRESNAIERIYRDPAAAEVEVSQWLLVQPKMSIDVLNKFQGVIAPGRPLRDRPGRDVQIGNHVALPGGPNIVAVLEAILGRANVGSDPWGVHLRFELLHPYMDGNGRTGRILWAWQMLQRGDDPFALNFLHRFYYDTLANARRMGPV